MERQRVIKTERDCEPVKRGSKASVRGLGACEPWQHGLKPPKRNLPLQWQIRQIRDDPWKPIGVLTAGERPWPRPAGCITVGKRSCQGQAGPRLSTMPPHWRHTVRAAHPLLPSLPAVSARKHSQAVFSFCTASFWRAHQLTGAEINPFQRFWHFDNV